MLALPHWEFRLLFNLMKKKLRAFYDHKGYVLDLLNTDNKVIGFPKKPADGKRPPNLCEHIHEEPAVQAYMKDRKPRFLRKSLVEEKKVNPHRFHALLEIEVLARENPALKIQLNGIYEHVFFIYLGYESVEDFRAKIFQ